MMYCLIPEEEVLSFSSMLEQQFQMKIPCTVLTEDRWHYIPVSEEIKE